MQLGGCTGRKAPPTTAPKLKGNKMKTFNEGDEIQIAVFGNTSNIISGIIVGLSVEDEHENYCNYWLVKPASPLRNDYNYSVYMIQETFLRKRGFI